MESKNKANTKIYRVGIVGCGRIAGGAEFEKDKRREHPYTHAEAYKSNNETQIIAACDINRHILQRFSKRWSIQNLYTDYNLMFEKEDLDIISICTHAKTHAEIAKSAAKAGIKTIFCEKPLASNMKEAKEMLMICSSYGVKIVVNYTRRWRSHINFAKKLVGEGRIGDITSLTARYVSGLRIMGTHMLDALRYFCGDVEWVFGYREETNVEKLPYSENYTPEDPSYSALMSFKNGVLCFLDGSCNKNYAIFELILDGKEGRIRIEDNLPVRDKRIELWKKGNYNNFYGLIKVNLPKIEYKTPILNAVRDVVDCIKKRKESISSGYNAYKIMELTEAIEKSATIGRRVYL